MIDEAARIDRASWSILWNILVPLLRPGILTAVLLIFIEAIGMNFQYHESYFSSSFRGA